MTISKEVILFGMSLSLLCCRNKEARNFSAQIDSPPVEEGMPKTPRIDFVEMANQQPHENDKNTIWYDDFLIDKNYVESAGGIDTDTKFGSSGGSMIAGFNKGETGKGDRKLVFGDFAGGYPPMSKKDQKFDDIYWRIYVKHEYGWEGSPHKMSRATSIVSSIWQQSMKAFVWSESGDEGGITLDPVRCVDGQTDQIRPTKYNDFENQTYLGNKPPSAFKISSTKESGYWVLVESRAKLNTPGKDDGINQLWIDGRLEAERINLNFRGSYIDHGINAVFLESHWGGGAIKTQGRWFDNFVVSTSPIGPVACPANPTLFKIPYDGPNELAAWEIELASDYDGNDVVFKSNTLGTEENVAIENSTGTFSGSLEGESMLSSGKIYFGRVRQQSTNGEWSEWSRWHQGFKIE